jgi:hypothetical protein
VAHKNAKATGDGRCKLASFHSLFSLSRDTTLSFLVFLVPFHMSVHTDKVNRLGVCTARLQQPRHLTSSLPQAHVHTHMRAEKENREWYRFACTRHSGAYAFFVLSTTG